MHPKGVTAVACAIVENLAKEFHTCVLEYSNSGNYKHYYTPEQMYARIKNKLEEVNKKYEHRMKFLDGVLIRHVCDIINHEPNKFINQVRKVIDDKYGQARGHLLIKLLNYESRSQRISKQSWEKGGSDNKGEIWGGSL